MEELVGINQDYNLCGEIENCVNKGSVDAKNTVGGIIASNIDTVKNCVNKGSVDAKNTVGGIVGKNSKKVKKCINSGAVNGKKDVGGIAGIGHEYDDAEIIDCQNTGVINGSSGEKTSSKCCLLF